MTCEHVFIPDVTTTRLTDESEGTAFQVSLTLACVECHAPLVFAGLPLIMKAAYQVVATTPDGQEVRLRGHVVQTAAPEERSDG